MSCHGRGELSRYFWISNLQERPTASGSSTLGFCTEHCLDQVGASGCDISATVRAPAFPESLLSLLTRLQQSLLSGSQQIWSRRKPALSNWPITIICKDLRRERAFLPDEHDGHRALDVDKEPKVTFTKSPRCSSSQHLSVSTSLWSLVLAPVNEAVSICHIGMLPLSPGAPQEPDSSPGSQLHFTSAGATGTLTPSTVDFLLSIGSPESREGNQIPLKPRRDLKERGRFLTALLPPLMHKNLLFL